MRIAQVSPLAESVPPKRYGGTERVVSYLTEGLVELGHDVTLFASGDSVTSARLIAACPRALRLDPHAGDLLAPHIVMLEAVAQRVQDFDIVHFHTDYWQFPVVRRLDVAHLTTLHGRLDLPHLPSVYREFSDIPVVSISGSQREPLGTARWAGTVYHGLPGDLYHFHERPADYLAFLGRISPEKRVDRAIEIARRTGIPLKIAAKVDDVDREYFEREIRQLLNDPLVEFVGEIGDAEKDDFLGNAKALLFPIDWPEPFGMVMIEALACGTPVIAFRCGSVPEVLEHGVTGYIVDDLDEAVRAVGALDLLSRRRCREQFDARFSARRMAEDYVRLYQRLHNERRAATEPWTGGAGTLDGRIVGVPAGGGHGRESPDVGMTVVR